MREMEFLDGLQDTRHLIWDFLAPGLSSMLSPSSTEASSKTGETVFRNYAVQPMMKYIESRINRRDRYNESSGIMQSYGDNYYLRVKDFSVTDKVLEIQEIETAAKFHKLDEIRKEYYGKQPIGDKRGGLLIAEMKSAPFGNDEPQAEQGDPRENNDDIQDDQESAKKNEYIAELIKWREKAVKRGTGRVVEYESDIIPSAIKSEISAELPGTKSKQDIRRLFQRYITNGKAVTDFDALRLTLETAMRMYAKA